MTIRGRFFTRSEYMQHVYSALVNFPAKIKTLPPAIVKSKEGPLWSGKQVKLQTKGISLFCINFTNQSPIQIISTIVVNLTPEGKPPPTLYSSAKIKPSLFEKEPRRRWRAGGQLSGTEMSEAEVIFKEGEFLSGTGGNT